MRHIVPDRVSRHPLISTALAAALLLAACSEGAQDTQGGTVEPGLACLERAAEPCRNKDFTGVDLSGSDLSGRDLAFSKFEEADLSGADLSGANLFGASMQKADLSGADLSGAEMHATDMRSTQLDGADLSDANLTETNFYGADLRNSRLDGSLLQRTGLGGTDLRNASIVHAVATRTDLRGAKLEGSDWQDTVVRDEYPHAAELGSLGALVCGFSACSRAVSGEDIAGESIVDADMFHFSIVAQMRTASAFIADPPALSRHVATTMLAGTGVYEHGGRVQGWTKPDVSLPAGLLDIAALYAINNTSIALRFSTSDPTRNTILQPVEGPRDTILWRATSSIPETRAAIVYAATTSGAAALERAAGDGFAERPTTYDVASGAWKPTLPGLAPALQPGWGTLLTFGASARSCRAGAPEIDASDVQEVVEITKNLTREQKDAARFWDDERIRTTTPVGHWHDIAAQVIRTKMQDGAVQPREAVLLLTTMHMAMSDAMVMTWYEKYTYRTARPITVIRETDPYWNSYLGNPPFPAYPSGHAAISAAASEVLARGLGEFEFTDNRYRGNSGAVETLNSKPRTYPNVRAAAEEAALSRVWGGIHFVADAEGGRRIGLCTAEVHVGR